MACQYPNCVVKRASFNYIYEQIGIYCKKHKLENMVNIDHRYSLIKENYDKTSEFCIELSCHRIAIFAYKNYYFNTHCNIHKKENMFTQDLRKKLCVHDDCTNFKEYPKDRPRYCILHASDRTFKYKYSLNYLIPKKNFLEIVEIIENLGDFEILENKNE